jgi:AcrR family transcriptional regulator
MTSTPVGEAVQLIESGESTVPTLDRRAQRRKARHAQGREEILDAAEQVFGQDGPRDGSLRRIAQQSGFSPAGIYVFFENKEALLAETLRRRGDEWIATVQVVAESDGSSMEKLHRIIDLAVDFFGRYPNFRLLLRHIDRWTTIAGPVDNAEGHYLDVVTLLGSIMNRGQEKGEIRSGGNRQLAHLYSVLVNEFVLLDAVGAPVGGGGAISAGEFHELIDGAFRSGRATAK